MNNIHLEVPEDFLDGEERCGYYISNKMKKVWAIQMDMLCELDRICKKYGLTYYADAGTLIGAIRHKGFIPWDDDIDIVMMRSDYQKLLSLGQKEFKDPLFFQSIDSDKKYIRGLAKLRNSSTTAIDETDLDKPFNRGIFIDIFPLDNVPSNKVIRKLWCRKIKFIRQILRNWAYFEATKSKNMPEKIIRILLKKAVDKIGYKKVYKYFERTCGAFNNKNCKYVSFVAYSYGKEKHIWERRLFEKSHRVPFEFIEINIPDGYDRRLRIQYGDYMIMKKIPSDHGAMILEPDIPYKEYVKTHDPRAEIMKIKAKEIIN